ncbi:MAG: ABC transporter substrate-binding protein [Actinomycetota bacterium]
MESTRKRWWRPLAAAMALALVAVACGGDGDDGGDDGEEDAQEEEGELETVEEGEELEAGEEGTISVLHAMTGETDVAGLRAAFEEFTAETGITVQEQGSGDFEQLARSRVEGGNPPDIVLHPQPGLMRDLVDQELAVPATEWVDRDQLESDMVGGLVELGEWNDEFYGLMMRLSLKSLVWYDPQRFEENGYEVPETWEEMMELSDQMVADGNTPWAIGIESADATGWVATDWLEDIMLRVHGGEVYDEWTTNDIPFDSPEVREAIEDYFDPIFFGEDYVFGGTPNILQTAFGDSIQDVFDGNAMMHRQASFIQGFMPDEAEIGENIDFFYLPPIEESGVGAPALIAGDLATAYTENPSNQEFFEYFSTPESGEPWAAEGAWLSPFTEFDTSAYADASLEAQGEILAGADFARFDGSDMMPGAVGAGAFWTEMVQYIQNEGEGLDEALTNIDDAWPN